MKLTHFTYLLLPLSLAMPITVWSENLQFKIIVERVDFNSTRGFNDVGQFSFSEGNLPLTESVCPGNTNSAGELICRISCSSTMQRTIKIISPITERTRGYESPSAEVLTINGCVVNPKTIKLTYKNTYLALNEVGQNVPMLAGLATVTPDTDLSKLRLNLQSFVSTDKKMSVASLAALERFRVISANLEKDSRGKGDGGAAEQWASYSTAVSNMLLIESAKNNGSASLVAKFKMDDSKDSLYKNLNTYTNEIEKKPQKSTSDVLLLDKLQDLRKTSSQEFSYTKIPGLIDH